MDRGPVRAELDRSRVAGEGFVVAILVAENVAQILVGLDEMRVEPDRLAVRILGLGESLMLGLDNPHRVVTARVGRVQCQGESESGLGLVESFGRRQGNPELLVQVDGPRRQPHCFHQGLDGLERSVRPFQRDPQTAQDIDVVGSEHPRLLVWLYGLGESALIA